MMWSVKRESRMTCDRMPQRTGVRKASRSHALLTRVCYASMPRRVERGQGEPHAGERQYMEVMAVRS